MSHRADFEIVSATTRHAVDLAAMYQAMYPGTESRIPDLERWLAAVIWNPQAWLYIAYDRATHAGIGFLHATVQIVPGLLGRQVTMEELYVDAKVQGQGVGKALFETIRDRCRDEGDVKVLQVRAPRGSDQDPTEFYQKIGFEAFPMTIYRMPTPPKRHRS